jgi:hypothetical protein
MQVAVPFFGHKVVNFSHNTKNKKTPERGIVKKKKKRRTMGKMEEHVYRINK